MKKSGSVVAAAVLCALAAFAARSSSDGCSRTDERTGCAGRRDEDRVSQATALVSTRAGT